MFPLICLLTLFQDPVYGPPDPTPAPAITWDQEQTPPDPDQSVPAPPPEMPDVPDTKGSVLDVTNVPPEDVLPLPPPPARAPWVEPGKAGVPDDYPMSFYGVAQWGWPIGGTVPLTCDGWRLASWGSGGAVASTDYSGSKQQPLSWSNMLLHGQPGTPGGENMVRWGIIAFDINRWNFYRCTTQEIPKEHGIYATINGGPVTWEECEFNECWGQAIQIVYAHPENPARKFQTALPAGRWYRLANALQDEWITVRRCTILQSSIYTKSERASYPISKFEPLGKNGPWLNKLLVEGCYMKTSWPWVDPNGFNRDSCGAIMSHAGKHVTIRRNYLEYKLGDRDVIQLWGNSDGKPGTPDVVIEENYILASQNIDIRLRDPSDTVIIRRNRGTCNVVISSPEQPWYSWPTSPNWNRRAVIYQGPVGQDYQLN